MFEEYILDDMEKYITLYPIDTSKKTLIAVVDEKEEKLVDAVIIDGIFDGFVPVRLINGETLTNYALAYHKVNAGAYYGLYSKYDIYAYKNNRVSNLFKRDVNVTSIPHPAFIGKYYEWFEWWDRNSPEVIFYEKISENHWKGDYRIYCNPEIIEITDPVCVGAPSNFVYKYFCINNQKILWKKEWGDRHAIA